MTSEQMQTSLTAWPKSAIENYVDNINNHGDVAIIESYHVGFYAAYFVAYYVSVVSVREGQEHHWSACKHCPSKSYSSKNVHSRPGTKVTLFLDDANMNLVEGDKLKAYVSNSYVTGGFPVKVTTNTRARNDRRKRSRRVKCASSPTPSWPQTQLPSGWTMQYSRRTGDKYYIHVESGATTWTKPNGY